MESEKVKVSIDLLPKAHGWKKDMHYFKLSMQAIDQGLNYIYMPKSDYDEMTVCIAEQEAQWKLLCDTVEANNLGKELEKNGDREKAIEVYEKNVERGYPATHSYDRLLVIYRRQKDYTNEIRIIKKAIHKFPKEEKYKTRLEKANELLARQQK